VKIQKQITAFSVILALSGHVVASPQTISAAEIKCTNRPVILLPATEYPIGRLIRLTAEQAEKMKESTVCLTVDMKTGYGISHTKSPEQNHRTQLEINRMLNVARKEMGIYKILDVTDVVKRLNSTDPPIKFTVRRITTLNIFKVPIVTYESPQPITIKSSGTLPPNCKRYSAYHTGSYVSCIYPKGTYRPGQSGSFFPNLGIASLTSEVANGDQGVKMHERTITPKQQLVTFLLGGLP